MKKNDASKRNGVVGKTGRKIPMQPNTNDKTPNMINNGFLILLNIVTSFEISFLIYPKKILNKHYL